MAETAAGSRGPAEIIPLGNGLEWQRVNGGMIRVGVTESPKSYKFSITYDDSGEFAEILGYYYWNPHPREFESVIRAINQATGKLVAYDKAGPPRTRWIQIPPSAVRGRILMSQEHSHKHRTAAEALNADGSVNQQTVLTHALEALAAIARGDLTVTAVHDSPDPLDHKTVHFSFTARAK